METLGIDIEVRLFLQRTGLRQSTLAREAGVTPTTISYLVRGVRRDVKGRTQDAIRGAMNRLEDKLQRQREAEDGFVLP